MVFRWATIQKYHFLTVSQKKKRQLILLASQQFLVGVYFKKAFVDLVVQYPTGVVPLSDSMDYMP